MSEKWNKTIDRPAMDAVLYGILKSLEYLGEQRRVILDRIGELMLQYLIEVGKVEPPSKPDEFAQSLRRLLEENGYGRGIVVRMRGNPPTPSVSNFVEFLMPGENQRDGRPASTLPSGASERKSKVDWVLYEMLLYGMTKALDDQLGAQAQLILDRIGNEIINYLIEIGAIERSDDPYVFIERLKGFFLKAGFARSGRFELRGSPPTSLVATWKYARYYSNVLRRLRKEGGSVLLSCPLCVASESIIGRSFGFKFQNFVDLRFLPGGTVQYRHKIYPPGESFTEADAQKVSQTKPQRRGGPPRLSSEPLGHGNRPTKLNV